MPISIFPPASGGSTAGLAPLDSPSFTTKVNFPAWHTNARPLTGVGPGTGGYNLDLGRLELYSGTAWSVPVSFNDIFTATTPGLVPASASPTGQRYLRDDFTFQVPPTGGSSQTFTPEIITASSNITITANDKNIYLSRTASPAPTTITLEAGPVNGSWHSFKDIARNCSTYPVTIVPAAGTIDGQANFVIDVDGLSVRIEHDGTEWGITWFYNPNTVKGQTFAQLLSSGPLLATDKFVLDRAGQDLGPLSSDIANYVNTTPSGERITALPATLTQSDNGKIVTLSGSAGALGADGTLVNGFKCDVFNGSTGNATYASSVTGLLGTLSLASGYITTIFKSNGTVYARPATGTTVTITPATGYNITQSSTVGGIGSTDTFHLTPTPAGSVWPASMTITPSVTGTGAGTMSAYVPPANNSSADIVFTLTATGVGSLTIAFANNKSLTPSPSSLNYTISSTPILTVQTVSPTGTGTTAVANGVFSGGAPTVGTLSATLNGAALSISSITVNTTSGSGSTAAGNFQFNYANPSTPGSYNLVVSNSGTYSSTSNAFSYSVVTAAITVSTITAPQPSTSFLVSGTAVGFTLNGLMYSTDSSTGTDGTWTAVTSPNISGSNWSFTMPGLGAGTYHVWVRDSISTNIYGESNSIVISNPSGTITAPGSSTVNQPAAFPVTVSGSGSPSLFASITSGGVEQLPRTTVPFGTTAINMTPTQQAASTANLYLTNSSPTIIASSASFTPAAAATGGYGQVQGTNAAWWYNFSDLSTLFSNTNRSSLQTTAGGAVQGVADKSGNGVHLSQPTIGIAPTLANAVQNGRSGLAFVYASQQYLQGVASTALTNMLNTFKSGSWTILLVQKQPANNAGTYTGGVRMSGSFVGNLEVTTHLTGGTMAVANRSYPGGTDADAFAVGNAAGIVVKAVATFNNSTKVLSILANGGTLVTNTGPTGTDSGSWTDLFFGWSRDYMDGNLLEAAGWPALATPTEMAALLTTATAYWGS